jgi:hypothetical protein
MVISLPVFVMVSIVTSVPIAATSSLHVRPLSHFVKDTQPVCTELFKHVLLVIF